MKNKLLKRTVSILIAVLLLSISIPVFAQDDDKKRVFDDAEILAGINIDDFEADISEMQEKHDIDVIVITTTDNGGTYMQAFADDFLNNNGSRPDGILFALNMQTREYGFSTKGEAIRIFTDDRFDDLEYAVVTALQHSASDGIDEFLRQTAVYCKKGIPSNQYTYNTQTGEYSKYRNVSVGLFLLFAAISLAIGFIVCLCIVAKYKLKFSQYHYPLHDRGGVTLSANQDIYLREHTTSVVIQSNSSSSGGGGSGRSSSSGSNGGRSGGF